MPGVRQDDSQGLSMPWPVGPEWEQFGAMPPQFAAEKVWAGGQEWESLSYSLGLRPLRFDGELCTHVNTEDGVGFAVELSSGSSSRIVTSQRRDAPYTFDIKVWSSHFESALQEDPPSSSKGQPFVCSTCRVRKTYDGTRSELVRSLIYEGPVVQGAWRNEGPTVAVAVINFMLEMEARAWLACRNFPLVEVWRGVRRPEPVYFLPVLNVIQSYALGTGHAALSPNEQADGPCYSVAMARELSALLPDCPHGANSSKKPGRGGKSTSGREYAEGNVNVESFAAALDRVTRRASPEADIFRKFVDLGSGRGHAVLAAHALFPFRSCVGCELVPEVVEVSRAAARRYVESGLAFYALSQGDPAQLFQQGNFFQDLNWGDASVVFANALTFPKAMIQELGKQALRLRRGAVFIITVKPLPTDDLTLLEAFDIRGEAVLMGFMEYACRLWVYQRR
uniref:Histone-lysine N-methyltransferase, H3 lysine-79 specific n=1 Tax=Alexandrium monilatum TaxID=311494 RepID=A0A7S4PXH5_9DINO